MPGASPIWHSLKVTWWTTPTNKIFIDLGTPHGISWLSQISKPPNRSVTVFVNGLQFGLTTLYVLIQRCMRHQLQNHALHLAHAFEIPAQGWFTKFTLHECSCNDTILIVAPSRDRTHFKDGLYLTRHSMLACSKRVLFHSMLIFRCRNCGPHGKNNADARATNQRLQNK